MQKKIEHEMETRFRVEGLGENQMGTQLERALSMAGKSSGKEHGK